MLHSGISSLEKIMKTFRAFLVSFLMLANSAIANTFGTDMTDLWWNANESGWGVTVTHQGEVVFLTFFVYGADNKPTFYTATASYTGTTSQGAINFSGPMYVTSGPWLGTFFNPNTVTARQVGTATFSAFVSTATLTYSVDGTSVSKSLTRQTFRNNDLSGQYGGVFRETDSGCTNPNFNGTSETTVGVAISLIGTSIAMSANTGTQTCNYSGTYSQAGRMGRVLGTYSCPGVNGTIDLIEVEATPRSVTGRFTASNNLCSQITGTFVLAKR